MNSSDGCTGWFDSLFGYNWRHCCEAHDAGSSHWELAQCVINVTPAWLDWMGVLMFVGVVVFLPFYRLLKKREDKK